MCGESGAAYQREAKWKNRRSRGLASILRIAPKRVKPMHQFTLYHSPLEGESQKPSRRRRLMRWGGAGGRRQTAAAGSGRASGLRPHREVEGAHAGDVTGFVSHENVDPIKTRHPAVPRGREEFEISAFVFHRQVGGFFIGERVC